MTDSHRTAHEVGGPGPRIGPVGAAARLCLGVALIALELFWHDARWWDPVLGLVILPVIVVTALAVRSRLTPAPLDATGPVGHLVNAAVFVPLLFIPATAGGALLFYGASMLVASSGRAGGCEITAISNLLLRRRDEVGCMVFAPVDIAESHARRSAAANEVRR